MSGFDCRERSHQPSAPRLPPDPGSPSLSPPRASASAALPFGGSSGREYPRGRVLVANSSDSFAAEAAAWLTHRRHELAGRLGHPPVTALSGGNTPRPVYRLLGETAAAADPGVVAGTWIQVDERDVLPAHPDSNQGMIDATLLAHRRGETVWIPFEGAGEGDPGRVIARYEARLRAARPGQDAPADLAWLGLGEDGHTASLFPGTPWEGRLAGGAWVAWYGVPRVKTLRFTLTFAALAAIPELVFLVTGSGKADLLARLLEGRADDLPAGALTARRPATWLLDPPAASRL